MVRPLLEMNFDEKDAIEALVEFKGDVDKAAGALLAWPPAEVAPNSATQHEGKMHKTSLKYFTSVFPLLLVYSAWVIRIS